MLHGSCLLRSTTAVALLGFGGIISGTPARADCVTSGATTTCNATAPNPRTTTLGAGRGDDGRTVVLQDGAAIGVTNRNGISLGDKASIRLRSGSAVRGDQNTGGGLYGSGQQPVEFNSNGTLRRRGGRRSIVKTGSEAPAEAVNVHGFGNRIENHGSISRTAARAAIWFEDQTTGAKNVVDNYGTDRADRRRPGDRHERRRRHRLLQPTGAVVDGSLRFAGGDDDLFFFAGSTVTGAIDGGAGINTLMLRGRPDRSDTLARRRSPTSRP